MTLLTSSLVGTCLIRLHLIDRLVPFLPALDPEVLVEKASVPALDEAVALRSADPGGPEFDALQLEKELVGMPVQATAVLSTIVPTYINQTFRVIIVRGILRGVSTPERSMATMTQETSSTEYLLVAIDVAKRAHEVLVQWPDGKSKSFRVPTTHAEFQRLTTFLHDQQLPVRAALEPTADFHRPIAHWLIRHQVEVHLASSLACARVREALFNSWDKNDRKDARVIMYLLTQGLTEPFHDPLVHSHMHLQELANTYLQISLAKSRLYHSLLNHYLPLFFPEFERYILTSRADWICRFLCRFPTPNSITALKEKEFIKEAWPLVGKKRAKQPFLEGLYETAQKSIALPIPVDDPAVETFRLQLGRYQDGSNYNPWPRRPWATILTSTVSEPYPVSAR